MAENKRLARLPRLKSGDILLRLAGEDDIPAIIQFYRRNRRYLSPFEPIRPKDFLTTAYWQKRVAKSLDEFRAGNALRLFLFRPHVGDVIGSINFSEIVRGAFHACYLGYSLDQKEQGQGIMTRCLRAGIKHVFEKWNLHRIMANYLPRNHRSGNVLRRLGFAIEGIAHDYLQIQGVWEDHVLTSLTNLDWKKVPS